MKKVNYIILSAVAALACTACDWLDVTPRSETKESVMFSSEYGYKSALTGVYIRLASADLYGKNMSMYIPELMAHSWSIPSKEDDVMNRIANFDYVNPSVEELFAKVWVSYYNAIVQANDILEHIETSTVKFEYDNGELIRGEALGLRAFLHFDLLRMFGPVPSAVQGDPPTIPYVTEKTKELGKLTSRPWSEVIANIETDLLAAEAVLKDIDPITLYSNDGLNKRAGAEVVPLQDEWQFYRQTRFNYYACQGALARFYQWTGQKEKAVEYALKVVGAKNSDGSAKFALTEERDYTAVTAHNNTANLSMWEEHLFGAHNPDLQGIVAPLFKNNPSSLSQRVEDLDVAYEKTVNRSDIRYKPTGQPNRYWEEKSYQGTTRINHFRKYTGNDQISADNRIPLIRVSEMYLILIENLPLAEAATHFATYSTSRSMVTAIVETSMASEQARMERVEKEYRKEFLGEGQMFYFYKRMNVDRYLWPKAFGIRAGAFVPPLPESQSMFE